LNHVIVEGVWRFSSNERRRKGGEEILIVDFMCMQEVFER